MLPHLPLPRHAPSLVCVCARACPIGSDIKAANVFLGESDAALLGDFGIGEILGCTAGVQRMALTDARVGCSLKRVSWTSTRRASRPAPARHPSAHPCLCMRPPPIRRAVPKGAPANPGVGKRIVGIQVHEPRTGLRQGVWASRRHLGAGLRPLRAPPVQTRYSVRARNRREGSLPSHLPSFPWHSPRLIVGSGVALWQPLSPSPWTG
jgi:hypothetical protein